MNTLLAALALLIASPEPGAESHGTIRLEEKDCGIGKCLVECFGPSGRPVHISRARTVRYFFLPNGVTVLELKYLHGDSRKLFLGSESYFCSVSDD